MSGHFQASKVDESVIMEPYRHLYETAEEDSIKRYVQAMNSIIQAPKEAAATINEVVDLVVGSLTLTDDILDRSRFRGKVSTANEEFGIPKSLTASWYSFLLASEKLMGLGRPQAVEILVRNLKSIYEGQAMDVIWRDSVQCPSQKQWLQMTSKKTGGFLTLVTELLQLFAQDSRDFTKLNRVLALFFQVQDDLKDLKGGITPNYAEDIHEGKFGFPLMLAIQRRKEKLELGAIKMGMGKADLRGKFIRRLLRETHALPSCYGILKKLEIRLKVELNALGVSEFGDILSKRDRLTSAVAIPPVTRNQVILF